MVLKISIADYSNRELSKEMLQLIYTKKWFKIFIPKKYGGLEASLKDGLNHLFDSASMHGGLGWCVNLGSGANFFAAYFEDNTHTQVLFSPREFVIAGSGKYGQAIAHENGLIVSGKWVKATGSAHATFISGNVKIANGEIFSVLIPKNAVKFKDDWNAFALKSTSSWSFEVNNYLVPEFHLFKIDQRKNQLPYPIFNLPFEDFARFSMTASALGIAKCFSLNLNQELNIYSTELDTLIFKLRIELLDYAQRYWGVIQKEAKVDTILRQELSSFTQGIGEVLYKAANELFFEIGLRLSSEHSISYQSYLDLILCCQHSLLKPKHE